MRAADGVPQWLVGRYRPLRTIQLSSARRASCLRGLAGGLFAAGSIHLEFIVEDRWRAVRLMELEPMHNAWCC